VDDELTSLVRIKVLQDEWLIEEQDSLFATLHGLLNYCFVLAKEAVGSANVNWSYDREDLYYKGEHLSMTD
jgi:hypothetical protein